MTKQVHFVATNSDLMLAVRRAESHCDVEYVDFRLREKPDGVVYQSLADWPQLGISDNGRDAGYFLVLPKKTEIRWTRVDMDDGTVRFKIDSSEYPTSFVLYPSGLYRSEDMSKLTVGKIGTAQQGAMASQLYEKYKKQFLKEFKREKWLWVGAEAGSLMKSGVGVA